MYICPRVSREDCYQFRPEYPPASFQIQHTKGTSWEQEATWGSCKLIAPYYNTLHKF